MKLIGIVIKQYGNLFKEQIFNFSDEYRIEYNFNMSKLDIKKNEDYIEGFYHNLIYNITPIVGINGSGKTTFLNFVYYYYSSGNESIKNSKFFRVYKKDNAFFIEKNNIEILDSNIEYSEDFYYQKFQTIIKNCTISRGYRGGTYDGTHAAAVKFDLEEFPNIFKSYKWLNKEGIINSKLKIELSVFNFGYNEKYSYYRESRGVERIVYVILFNILEEIENKGIIGGEVLYEIQSRKLSYYEIFDLINSLNFKEFKNIFEKSKELIKQLLHLKEIGIIEESKVEYEENKIYIISSVNNLSNLEKFRNNYLELTELLRKSDIYKRIFDSIYISMSKGESNLINTFAYIYEAFEINSGGDWILVVDEMELGLHIEWSRLLIDKLVKFVEQTRSYINNNNLPTFQIIFTTHSPFMLSDIKQGNVIALTKEGQYSKVVDIGTSFAKNILEIMHKDFFIKDIYGGFASKKINNIINDLRTNNSDENTVRIKEMKVVIDSIGEPLLRKKLQKMYNKKYFNIEEDTDLQPMIDRLIKLGYRVEKDK